MTKDVFIIPSYPNTTEKLQLLQECVSQIKKLGIDIMLISNFPLPEEIYSSVKYYIYDETNDFVPKSYYSRTTGLCMWFEFRDKAYFQYFDYHTLPGMRNMKLSVSLAASAGYEYFYYTSCDNIFSDSDLHLFNKLKNELIVSDRKILFFENRNFINTVDSFPAYQLIVFLANTIYFNEKFTYPITVEEWEKTTYCNSTEVDFYRFFTPYRNDILSKEISTFDYFKTSRLDISASYKILCGVLYNESNKLKPHIICNNKTLNDMYLEVYIDNIILNDSIIKANNFWIYELDISNNDYGVIIKVDGVIKYDKVVSKNNVDELLIDGRVRQI